MYQNDSEQNDSPKQRGLQTASSPKLVEGEKIVQDGVQNLNYLAKVFHSFWIVYSLKPQLLH